jgi:hypothetical protein
MEEVTVWDGDLQERSRVAANKITESLFGLKETTGLVSPWIAKIIAKAFGDLPFLQTVCEAAKDVRRAERLCEEALTVGDGIAVETCRQHLDYCEQQLARLIDHEVEAEGK